MTALPTPNLDFPRATHTLRSCSCGMRHVGCHTPACSVWMGGELVRVTHRWRASIQPHVQHVPIGSRLPPRSGVCVSPSFVGVCGIVFPFLYIPVITPAILEYPRVCELKTG